jgi:carbon storage regulator
MLILTRRPGQRIIMDNGFIEITLLSIRNNQARIGIEAPLSVDVYREEIFIKKLQEGYQKPNSPKIY